ncbi:MAG: hypothetical protein JW818_14475 [Pirellulales bacterium]|nr:hypothetical protein [Pirellulales bacterium]
MAPMKPEPPKRDPDLEGTLSLDQLARRWNVPRKEVRHLLTTQKLDFLQVRGQIRVRLADVDRYERETGHEE